MDIKLANMIITDRLLRAAYIAGVIDSDGWIIITKTPSSYRVTIGIKQQDSGAIEIASELFGGKIKISRPDVNRYSQKLSFLWIISDGRAADALEEILPFLHIKRRQASLAIEYQNKLNAWKLLHGKVKLPESELERRHVMYWQMRILNGYRAAATTKREGLDSDTNQVSDSLNCIDGKDAEVAEMTTRLHTV